jgi:hypothetical protein
MIISGYIYKYGYPIGSSGVIVDADDIKNAVARSGKEFNHVPCMLGYPKDSCSNDRAIAGGYNMDDVVGYATLKVDATGIYAFVEVIETHSGRIILSMLDSEIMEEFKFGFACYGERIDTNNYSGENKSFLRGNITIKYITLAEDNINYQIDKIER